MFTNAKRLVFLPVTALLLLALVAGTAAIPTTQAADRSPGCAQFNKTGSTEASTMQFYEGETLSVRMVAGSTAINEAGIYDQHNSVYIASAVGPFLNGDIINVSYTFSADASYNLSYAYSSGTPNSTSFSCTTPAEAALIDEDGFTLTEDGRLVQIPVDNRFNWHNGDLFALIYPGSDEAGSSALNLYCIIDDEGVLGFQVTEADIAAHDETLPASVPIMEAEMCQASFYMLDDGDYPYQINIWDAEGKLYETLCTDLSCATRISRFTDPNE